LSAVAFHQVGFSLIMRFLPPASAAGMAMLGGLIAIGVTG